jgi:hypothetical protein
MQSGVVALHDPANCDPVGQQTPVAQALAPPAPASPVHAQAVSLAAHWPLFAAPPRQHSGVVPPQSVFAAHAQSAAVATQRPVFSSAAQQTGALSWPLQLVLLSQAV